MHRLLMIGFLLAGSLWSVPAPAQVLSHNDLRDDKQGMPGEQQLQRVIEIGAGTRLPALVHVTNKGNGVLTIANLRLKMVDEHGDGATYQNGMPHVEFADVDGDGWKDLLVTGIVDYTDDKSDKVRKQESFTFLYRFDPQSKSFRQTYKRASFDLDEGPIADPRLINPPLEPSIDRGRTIPYPIRVPIPREVPSLRIISFNEANPKSTTKLDSERAEIPPVVYLNSYYSGWQHCLSHCAQNGVSSEYELCKAAGEPLLDRLKWVATDVETANAQRLGMRDGFRECAVTLNRIRSQGISDQELRRRCARSNVPLDKPRRIPDEKKPDDRPRKGDAARSKQPNSEVDLFANPTP